MKRLIWLVSFLFVFVASYAQNIWTGSGFALNKGYIATNWHVVDGAGSIFVYGINGDFTQPYLADVVVKDKVNDLAIIKILGDFQGFGTVPYKIVTSTIDVGEKIFVLGYPMTDVMGEELKCTDGIISSLSGYDGNVSTYQISAPIQHGNSGGPVFDENGNIIGIARSGIDNKYAQIVNYAVKSTYLKNLSETMHESSVLPNSSQMRNYSKLPDKIKAVRNFVFYIVCTDAYIPSSAIYSTSNSAQTQTTISVYPNSVKVSSKEETAKFEISTNADKWKVASMPDWCHIANISGSVITFNIDANKSHSNRTDYITFETNDGKTASVVVNQEAKEFSKISLNPNHFVGGKDVRSVKFDVITDASSWDVVGNPQWCTYKKQSGSLELFFKEVDVNDGFVEDITVKTDDGVEATAIVRINLFDVTFYCETPADLYVDGIFKGSFGGQREKTFVLNSGEHIIEAKQKYYKTYKESFIVQNLENQRYAINLTQETAMTTINSNVTGASIYVDGKYFGTTNGTFYLPLGYHSIKCAKNGYDSYESSYFYEDVSPREMKISMEIETKLSLSVGDLSFPARKGSERIGISSNKQYSVTYPSWTKVRSRKDGIKLIYSANKSLKGRTGDLEVKTTNGVMAKKLSFYQCPKATTRTQYYDYNGDWGITWFKSYGFCGYTNYSYYDDDKVHINFGNSFDFFAFRVKMFEFSLASFGYDSYCDYWEWTPRLRLNTPIWDSGSLFTDIGICMGGGLVDEFFVHLGVQWLYTDWGYLEAFVRGAFDLGIFVGGYAISAGFAFGFCSGY
ncbi:MAG: trypsin-like peptidase domain-containing protein [Bacteroidales bacterium]|nr:trypsin-like peptidase domain-containing protein [Bacteroidales bacterium]